MINLHLSFFTAKLTRKPTLRYLLLMTVALCLLFTVIFILSLSHGRSSEAKLKGIGQSEIGPHTLAASYYSVKAGLESTLMLSNQGLSEMPVRVSLFSRDGHQFDLPAISLTGHEVRAINLGEYIQQGTPFEDGNLQVEYQGKKLELGGVATIADAGRRIIFEEELVEPAKAFASSRLEGIWWRPGHKTETQLALSNTSNSPLSVKVTTTGPGHSHTTTISTTLDAHQTRLLRSGASDENESLDLKGTVGGISITHSGPPGALVAYGFSEDPSEGFSTIIDFSDPQKAKTARLDGAGLRIGDIAGQRLSQLAAVRNISSTPVTVSGRIPYTLANGRQETAELEDLQLAPGEAREINLRPIISRATRRREVMSAGLEFKSSGAPGSIIASALSMSADHDHVFRVPMRDSSVQSSSTGHYPWRIDDNSSTIAYIKNTTASPMKFVISVLYDGGMYGLSEQTILDGQTLVFDIRKLRDSQQPTSNGVTIPLDAAQGQIHWSITGRETKSLIGRAEQIDITNGISMTAACGLCCPDNLHTAFIDPDPAVSHVGDVGQFTLSKVFMDCNFFVYDPIEAPNETNWYCDNTSVATITGDGIGTAVGQGTAVIHNPFLFFTYYDAGDFCGSSEGTLDAAGTCDVISTACAIPKNFRQVGPAEQLSNGFLRFTYAWDSSTGNPADLDTSSCTVRERLNFPGTNSSYTWPSPPYISGYTFNNPSFSEPLITASEVGAIDTHTQPGFRTPYQIKMFTVKQRYQYSCLCARFGEWITMKGPINIVRSISNNPWKYTITKSGSSNSVNLP